MVIKKERSDTVDAFIQEMDDVTEAIIQEMTERRSERIGGYKKELLESGTGVIAPTHPELTDT